MVVEKRVAVSLGVGMILFGAINFAVGMSIFGERGARNKVSALQSCSPMHIANAGATRAGCAQAKFREGFGMDRPSADAPEPSR